MGDATARGPVLAGEMGWGPQTSIASSSAHPLPKSSRMSMADLLPPQSAKKYIKPMSGIALQALPSPPSPSTSNASSSSSFSAPSSSSDCASPPSDHGSLPDKQALERDKATREYHAAVASWTANTWQAVRFVIEQRSRHPAYSSSASPPQQQARSPQLPAQNPTSLHALSAQPGSASSSYTSTPSIASPQRHPTRDLPPSRLSSQLSFSKKKPAAPCKLPLSPCSSSSSPAGASRSSLSSLSALFASNAIDDATTSRLGHRNDVHEMNTGDTRLACCQEGCF